MALRDLGYMIRIRILTDNEFTWRQAFRVIMLWEFTSAVTPSAIGGTSLAILYVNKEGVKIGKSSAVVLATSFLDELYFIIFFPMLFLIVNPFELFIVDDQQILNFANEFFYFAIVGYSLKLLYTLFISYGLFINPRGLKYVLMWIFRLPVLRKWRQGMHETGTDIINSSNALRNKPFSFWMKAFIATFFAWTSRYWVVNVILLAFFVVKDHFLIFARQLVMWIMMLVSPTPGGSGFAEYVFKEYLNDFIPVAGMAVGIALIWRLVSYYPYLFMGVFIFPRWLKEKFGTVKTTELKDH
jgi:hypothetical protein